MQSRLFITPGHKTEVFCLAAEEARELCIPIVPLLVMVHYMKE